MRWQSDIAHHSSTVTFACDDTIQEQMRCLFAKNAFTLFSQVTARQ